MIGRLNLNEHIGDNIEFKVNQDDLFNIASGEKAASTDLVHAYTRGKEAIAKAKQAGGSKIEPPKIGTFGSHTKKKLSKKQTVVKLYQDELAVTRVLCFFRDADPDAARFAFSHEWTEYPSSLFEVDPRKEIGYAMRKGTKSDFLSELIEQANLDLPSELPESDMSTVILVDFMAFVNRFQTLGAPTFDEMNRRYVDKLIRSKPGNCNCVNIVGDRYDFDERHSLKGDERHRRNQTGTGRVFLPSRTLDVPDWRLLIGNSQNKANIQNFIASCLEEDYESLPDGLTFILGGMMEDINHTVSITSAGSSVINLPCTKHEEADTRIIAHLAYCVQHLNYRRAVVLATDTDIILLCLYHLSKLEPLQELWVQKHGQVVPLHTLAERLSEKYHTSFGDIASTLLATYVLSGCDTVSYPFRRGKKTAAKRSLDLLGSLPHLSEFGCTENAQVQEDHVKEARLYWTHLYGKPGIASLDMLRQHLFASSKSDIRSLPATEDSFYFHVLRALYQLIIYKRANQSELALPAVTDYGRAIVNERLVPVLMSKPGKPEIGKTVSCKCQASRCLSKSCSCAKADVPCCGTCACLGQQDSCGRVSCDDSSSSEDDED